MLRRWIESPVGGYATLSLEPPPGYDDRLQNRLQARAPALALTSGVRHDVADLPAGELCRFLLDGAAVDLTESRLERFDPSTDGSVAFLVPTDESPIDGRPIRLHLRWRGAEIQSLDDALVAPSDFHPVDCLQHDGEGRLRLSVWGGGPRDFPAAVFSANDVEVAVELLDATRPPYLLVMAEYWTDGLWDLATADNRIQDPVDLDQLALPDDVKQRIRRWHDRYEVGMGPEDPEEAEAIADELRRCWPASVITVQR